MYFLFPLDELEAERGLFTEGHKKDAGNFTAMKIHEDIHQQLGH